MGLGFDERPVRCTSMQRPFEGSGFGVQGAEFRVQGWGFRFHGSGFRVQGSGFRVQGSEIEMRGTFRPRQPAMPKTQISIQTGFTPKY